jgi:hypothetical protein
VLLRISWRFVGETEKTNNTLLLITTSPMPKKCNG